MQTKKPRKEGRKQAAYLLPTSLIRKIQREAASRKSYPARLVAEAVNEWFERQKPPAA
jgi:hypothetical protein